MEYQGFILDDFQEQAIVAIDNNHSVVVSAPTGSGKTLIADFIIDKHRQDKVIYTAPIKALSNQKYKEFTKKYGKDQVGLLTGDIVINPDAKTLIMTTEIYRNMVLTKDIKEVAYVIFDEIHYINDVERGYVWEESIIFSKEATRFLCLSATIPNAKEFSAWIAKIKGHEVETIIHTQRPVPLHKKFFDAELGLTTLEEINEIAHIPDYRHVIRSSRRRMPEVKPLNQVELVKDIKLPAFFFNFSRKGCQVFALELSKAGLFKPNPEISSYLMKKLAQAPKEVNNLASTRILRQTLPYGIAFHHAGLIPLMKELVEELFGQGLINVLYTTETFAVGINMPAKTVCFASLRKFDGMNFRFLNSKEYFQIAGRAGRRGIDKEGFVCAMIDRRDFAYGLLKRMTEKDVEPIKSQFRLSVNTVLNLIKNHSDAEIEKILQMSFYTYQKGSKDMVRNSFIKTSKKLAKLGYIKNDRLTNKGEFSSKIYADEIITGEIFATGFYHHLNEYQLLMVIACLCYEPRERTEFKKRYNSEFLTDLKQKVHRAAFKEHRFRHLDDMTALVHPCYYGKNFFEILDNTNFLEGDIIRFFRQMLDRMGQIRNATLDMRLQQMIRSCQDLVYGMLAGIDSI